MKYLGLEPKKPKIAVFDFTGCEGCELQLANKEETLVPFLSNVEIIQFREISTSHSDGYDVAFIDGSISRADEVARLLEIRKKAAIVVAMGSCACFGGVSKQKNVFSPAEANRGVYGDDAKETMMVRSIKEIVPVDFEIPGCPVSKTEIERIVQYFVWDIPWKFPAYPVCYECKQRFTVCRFELGELCLGPVTRGGCNAPCPTGGLGCWGCRGPAEEANLTEYYTMAANRGFGKRDLDDRFHFFGGFEGVL